jgi:hypothetical protein
MLKTRTKTKQTSPKKYQIIPAPKSIQNAK